MRGGHGQNDGNTANNEWPWWVYVILTVLTLLGGIALTN